MDRVHEAYVRASDISSVEDIVGAEEDVHQAFMELMLLGVHEEPSGEDEEEEDFGSVVSSEAAPEEPAVDEELPEEDEQALDEDEGAEAVDFYGEEIREFFAEPPKGRTRRHTLEAKFVQDDSEKRRGLDGVSGIEDADLNVDLPECLVVEAQRGNRPMLGKIESDVPYEVTDEGIWVLMQLCRPGGYFSRSHTARDLLERLTAEELNDSPLVRAIIRALHLITNEHLDPAHIARCHKDELYPLLNAFYDGDVPTKSESAYSTVTGELHYPCDEDYPGEYELRSNHASSQFSFAPEVQLRRTQRLIRRSGSIILGRILWEILSLSMLVHKLEQRRSTLIRDAARVPGLGAYLPALRRSTFTSIEDSLLWENFFKTMQEADEIRSVGILSDYERAQRNWFSRPALAVRDLGLTERLNDLLMSPASYQNNLLTHGDASSEEVVAAFERGSLVLLREDNIATRNSGQTLSMWLEDCTAAANVNKSTSEMEKLLISAMVQLFSHLPAVRRVVYDTFMLEGELLVTNSSNATVAGLSGGRSKIYRIGDLLQLNPLLYLNVFSLSRQTGNGPLLAELFVSIDTVLKALRVRDLYLHPRANQSDVFNRLRLIAFTQMATHTVDNIVQFVRRSLLQAAHTAAAKLAAAELGKLCSQGPYQPTHLTLSSIEPAASCWEEHWDRLEALPDKDSHVIPGHARVAGIYCAEKSETATFVFCDEHGNFVDATMWKRVNVSSEDGRRTHEQQSARLLELVKTHQPHVFALAALNPVSTRIFKIVSEFVHEHVQPTLGIDIPVIYALATTAAVYSCSALALEEFGAATSSALRSAVAVARFVRDPILELCRYFSPTQRDALHLPLRIPRGSDMDEVYRALEQEMSLWVTAVNYDVQQILAEPHAVRVFQFCAGLGPRRAASLVSNMSLTHPIGSRGYLADWFLHTGQPAVALSFSSSLRVTSLLLEDDLGSQEAHFADATAIPLPWYPIADRIVQWIMIVDHQLPRQQLHSTANVATAWTYVLEMSEEDRWACVCDIRYTSIFKEMYQDVYAYLRTLAAQRTPEEASGGLFKASDRTYGNGHQHLPTHATIDFILDEIIAYGTSYVRRNFRKISGPRLFKQLTGVGFSASATSPESSASQTGTGALVHIGDVIECAVHGYNPRRRALRLSTAYGVYALLGTGLSDLSNDTKRAEIAHFFTALDAYKFGEGVEPVAPEWARIGARIYGYIEGCNYGLCELKVRWVAGPPESSRAADENGVFDNAILWYSPAVTASSRSTVSSLRSVAIEESILNHVTKAAEHPLFRDAPNAAEAERQLLRPGASIGEVLLRPMRGRPRRIFLCIKAGTNCISSWNVNEERNKDGSLSYFLTSPLSQPVEFDSVDHIISTFVKPLTMRIKSLRQHRNFYDSAADAEARINAVVRQQAAKVGASRAFAYAITEVSRERESPVAYEMLFKVGGKLHRLPLIVDHKGYHCRMRTFAGADNSDWVSRKLLEDICTCLKTFVNEQYSGRRGASSSRAGSNHGAAIE